MKCSSFTCVPLHCQPQKASISVKPNTPKLQNVPLYKVHVQSSSSEKAHNKKCAGSPPAQVNGVKEQIHGSYQRTGSQNTMVKRLTYSSSLFDRAQKKKKTAFTNSISCLMQNRIITEHLRGVRSRSFEVPQGIVP